MKVTDFERFKIFFTEKGLTLSLDDSVGTNMKRGMLFLMTSRKIEILSENLEISHLS